MTSSTELKKRTDAAMVLANLSAIASQKKFVVITNQATTADPTTQAIVTQEEETKEASILTSGDKEPKKTSNLKDPPPTSTGLKDPPPTSIGRKDPPPTSTLKDPPPTSTLKDPPAVIETDEDNLKQQVEAAIEAEERKQSSTEASGDPAIMAKHASGGTEGDNKKMAILRKTRTMMMRMWES